MFSHVFTFGICNQIHMWNFQILHVTDWKWGLWKRMLQCQCMWHKKADSAKHQPQKFGIKSTKSWHDLLISYKSRSTSHSRKSIANPQNEMFLSFSNSKLRIWCVRPVIGWADSSMSSSESAWESTGGDCFSVTWLQHINCWNDGVHLGWCFKSFFGNCFKGTWWDFQSFRCSI